MSISDETPTSISCDSSAGNEVREQAGDALPLEVIDQPHHHAADFVQRGPGETGQRIHDHDRRFRLIDFAAWSRGGTRARTASAAPHGSGAALLHPAVEIRRPTACCALRRRFSLN